MFTSTGLQTSHWVVALVEWTNEKMEG
jgi:hypothetical protein